MGAAIQGGVLRGDVKDVLLLVSHACPTAAVPVDNTYCSCKLTRVRSGRHAALARDRDTGRGLHPVRAPPTTWTTARHDGPDHLAL